MSSHDQIILTPKGLALLEGMLRQLGNRHGILGAMLARKLDVAKVVPASELEPGVAVHQLGRERPGVTGGPGDDHPRRCVTHARTPRSA